jgi:hypothetical protein
MPSQSGGNSKPLPDTLLEDLRELLTWDSNCFLTWMSVQPDPATEDSRWFIVRLSSDGHRFGLLLEFWIPAWMNERGVQAILPAHLTVTDCRDGVKVSVDLGLHRWSELKAMLPKVARTSARLINELWGRTDAEGVLLLAMEQDENPLNLSFSQLPSYGA